MRKSCCVRIGLLGAVCAVCLPPLQSGGPNDVVRCVGAGKSGGELELCPSSLARGYACTGTEKAVRRQSVFSGRVFTFYGRTGG